MTEEINNSFREKVFFRKLRSQVDGNSKVEYGLTQIKGVGSRFAQSIIRIAKINPNKRIGSISESDLNQIEEIILNPIEHGIPNWMVNRPKDLRVGKDLHTIGNKLDLSLKNDIDRMKKIKSYKGVRHRLWLKVRGQRTDSILEPFVKKILDLMRLRDSDEVIIGLEYISELLDRKFLDNNKLSKDVVKFLESRSIFVSYEENYIRFKRIKKKK